MHNLCFKFVRGSGGGNKSCMSKFDGAAPYAVLHFVIQSGPLPYWVLGVYSGTPL